MNVVLTKNATTIPDLNVALVGLREPALERSKVLCVQDQQSWQDLRELWTSVNNYCDSHIYTSGLRGKSIGVTDIGNYDVIVLCATDYHSALTVLGQNNFYDKLLGYTGTVIGMNGFADVLSRNEHDGMSLIPCTIRFVENGAHTDDVVCYDIEDTSWYVGADQVVSYNGETLQITTLWPS